MAPAKIFTKTTTTKVSSILDLPVDNRNDLSLTRLNQLLYIPETGIWAPGKKATPIFDFSSRFNRSVNSWFTADYVGFNEDVMTQAKKTAAAVISSDDVSSPSPDPSIIFKLSRTHWYNDSKLIVTKPGHVHRTEDDEVDAPIAGNEGRNDTGSGSSGSPILAEYSSPLLAYGVTHISFPEDSLHSAHAIKIRPLNATRRSQSFVQDSVTYAWDMNKKLFPGGGGVLSLYKGIGATKKVEIGRYQSDNGKFVPGGMLVIDSDEVDVLVAVLTLLAVLGQRDSFSFPTGTHVP
ncbi:hypothetical protein BGW36DRAFT_305113 [Talaromyces proteolyticus]|uniref:Uncharacterized protein n=1 Tax=Talaromyces proteolyticus TaxID=1131652 RepID=A0AAD4PVR2_9EURO|nr:uncharacterized protein BGW36DRAFT_305113 [Talaromyces proteolyticus]KAH8691613.1 hypothetical protein BGW36DRAFT_305113 [Talaromyces proteolyticus]